MKIRYFALILPLVLSIAFAQGFDINKQFIEPYLFWIVLVFFASVVGGVVYASVKNYREEIAPFLGLFAGGAVALAIYVYKDTLPFLFGANILGVAIIVFLGIAAIAVIGLAGGMEEGLGKKVWLFLIIIGLLLVIVGSTFYDILSVIGVLLIFLGAIWGLIVLLMSVAEFGGVGAGAPARAPPTTLRAPSAPTAPPTVTAPSPLAPTAPAAQATLQITDFYPRRNQIVKPGTPIRITFNLPVHKRSMRRIYVRDLKSRTWLPINRIRKRIIRRNMIVLEPEAEIYPAGYIDVYIKTGPQGVIGTGGEFIPARVKYITFRFFAKESKPYGFYEDWYRRVMTWIKYQKTTAKIFADLFNTSQDPAVKERIKGARDIWRVTLNAIQALPKPETVRVSNLKAQKHLWKEMRIVGKMVDRLPKLIKKARDVRDMEDLRKRFSDFNKRVNYIAKAIRKLKSQTP